MPARPAGGRRPGRLAVGLAAVAAVAACRPADRPPAVAAWHGADVFGEAVQLGGGDAPQVLEWWSAACPYVARHYEEGALQRQQARWRRDGGAWWWVLSVPADAPAVDGGHLAAVQAAAGATVDRAIVDRGGALARALGVAVTPTVVVIDGHGRRVYRGAIDGRSRAQVAGAGVAGPPAVRQHLAEALAQTLAGRPVAVPESRPLGCALRLGPVSAH